MDGRIKLEFYNSYGILTIGALWTFGESLSGLRTPLLSLW